MIAMEISALGQLGAVKGGMVTCTHGWKQAAVLIWPVMSSALSVASSKLSFASWVCFSLGKFKTRSAKGSMALACFRHYVEWIKESSGFRQLNQFICFTSQVFIIFKSLFWILFHEVLCSSEVVCKCYPYRNKGIFSNIWDENLPLDRYYFCK